MLTSASGRYRERLIVTRHKLEPKRGKVGTKKGTNEKRQKLESLQVIGAKGGTRTLTVLPARS